MSHQDILVEQYQGIDIFKGPDGYYASNGVADHFGYTDTVEDIRAEIDDYWQGDEHGPLNGFFNEGRG